MIPQSNTRIDTADDCITGHRTGMNRMDDSGNRLTALPVFDSTGSYERMTELEISSARFDQQPATVKRKFVIFSMQRSGSFLLCRQLINAGIGIPQEYFNPLHTGILRKRWKLTPGDDRAYLRELYARRTTPNGVWGAKLQWPQYRAHPAVIDELLCDASQFIYLYRNDLAAQAVSLHVSLVTGIWGFDVTKTTRSRAGVALDDLQHVSQCAQLIIQEQVAWKKFFVMRQITPLSLSYEDLAEDQSGAVRRIAKLLGLEAREFRIPAPETRQDHLPSEIAAVKRDLRVRWQTLGQQ